MRNAIVALCVSGVLCVNVSAQQASSVRQVHELDLETSISVAKEQSRNMRKLRLNSESATFSLRAALAANRTRVSLRLTTPQYSETMRQFEDSNGITYYPIKQNTMSGTLSIAQPLPSDGEITISSSVRNTADLNDDTRNAQLTSSISLSQPISAFFGYNTYSMDLKRAKLSYERSMKSFKRQELDLVYNVTRAFYNLIRSREQAKIAQMTYENQRNAYDVAQSKFKAGLIREVEALQMEVDFSEAGISLDGNRVSYAEQQQSFKELLGIDMQDSITVMDDLSLKAIAVDEELAVKLAMQNRLEIRENAINIEQQEMSIRQAKANGRISGNINLDYNFIGVNKSDRDIPLRTSLGDTWDNLLARKGALGASVTVTVPILDWGLNKSRVRQAQNSLKQLQIDDEATKISIEREMRSSVSMLQRNLRSYLVLEKSVKLAEKSFQISLDRYSNGDINSEAIASERVRLNSTYVSRLTAYIEYKMLLSDIMRQTFYDFEKGVSLVDASTK